MGHERGVVGVVQRRMREEREGEQAREACACEALRWEKKNGEERPRLRLAFEGERGRRFRRFHVRYLRHSSFCSRALSRMHIRRGRRSVNSFPRKISSATKRILRQIVFANRPPQRTLTPLLSFLDVWTEDTEMRVMFLLLLFFFSSPVDCFGTESSSYKASNPAINRGDSFPWRLHVSDTFRVADAHRIENNLVRIHVSYLIGSLKRQLWKEKFLRIV